MTTPLLQVQSLAKTFGRGATQVDAVQDVSFDIQPGEIFGLVGESGSGKSTTARMVVGLVEPTAGRVLVDGVDVNDCTRAQMARVRRDVSMVFQDPMSSLNPRMSVGEIVGEGLLVHEPEMSREQRRERVATLLEQVGLSPRHRDRYPRQFSGGQRQRIALARALITGPRLMVCDEPVSALDVSVQAQVLNLLRETSRAQGVALLFIAHDLAVVRYLCDRIAVMRNGRIVELGTRSQLYEAPTANYTRDLLAAIPIPDPQRERARKRAIRSRHG